MVALAIVVGETSARSLRRLRTAAQALVRGDQNSPLRTPGPEEIEEMAAAFNDLAASLRAQLETAAAERERLEQTLALSADVVIALDGEGTVAYANPAAETALSPRPAPPSASHC